MNSFTHQLLGLLAGGLTTAAFVPQVLQVWRSRSARDISLGMYLIFISGIALWLLYGLESNDLPISIANTITLLLASAILAMKLVFDRRHPLPTDPTAENKP
jgi:MtN3 and saliva related transmembrane protein